MPSNSKCKKRADKRGDKKRKRIEIEDVVPDSSNVPENHESVSLLTENLVTGTCSSKDDIADDANSISSETLLCLEDVYETCTPPTLSPIEMWVPEVSNGSLIVGSGEIASCLCSQIMKLTSGHDIQVCSQEEAFEICNNKSFIMIWMLMTVPVGQDILSLTTSIRYASKCNRGTVLIGVSSSISNVDLRLHGIDEVVIQPVSNNTIRQKYSKWSSVQVVPEDLLKDTDSKDLTPSNPDTPLTPLTPSTPATPASTADDAEKSRFSLSLDSGVESPGTPSVSSEISCSLSNIVNLVPHPSHPEKQHNHSSADHTTKEKLRRERIKDSCDQLRVLLPYIRGRKTDMASILEMCVDYIKIVNAALPQEFQKQIVDMLSKDTSGGGHSRSTSSRKSKKVAHMTKSPSVNAVSSTVESDLPIRRIGGAYGVTPASALVKVLGLNVDSSTKSDHNALCYSFGEQDTTGIKRDLPKSLLDLKPSKRFRLQSSDGCMATISPSPSPLTPVAMSSVQALPSFESIKLSRQDSSSLDQSAPSFPYHHPLQVSHTTGLFGEYDSNGSRLFTSHDSFSPSSFFNTGLPAKQSSMDRNETLSLFLDTPSLYPYYGNSNMAPSFGLTPVPDYVNPNAVLPVYNGKVKHDGQKSDDQISMVSNVTPTSSTSK